MEAVGKMVSDCAIGARHQALSAENGSPAAATERAGAGASRAGLWPWPDGGLGQRRDMHGGADDWK